MEVHYPPVSTKVMGRVGAGNIGVWMMSDEVQAHSRVWGVERESFRKAKNTWCLRTEEIEEPKHF